MSYNQIVSQCTFTKNRLIEKWGEKKSWLVHLTFQSWFNFSTVLSRWLRKSFFSFLLLLVNEVGHVCVNDRVPYFSLTLITSFTNLQIYYSTVCKGVNAITSSVVSRPVMTNRTNEITLLKLANLKRKKKEKKNMTSLRIYRVKTRFKEKNKLFCSKISSVSKQLLLRSTSWESYWRKTCRCNFF